MIAITAATLFTPLERIEPPLLLVEDGTIVEVTTRARRELPPNCRTVDFGDGILAPGLVDIHIHGGAGYDVMEVDASGLCAVEQLLFKHGVTSYFPTTVTAPLDQTWSALDRLADAIESASREDPTRAGSEPSRSAFIWKDLFSATSAAACILQRTCCRPLCRRSIASGRRRGATFAS